MENIDDQQIEDYLRNKMTPDERQAFENALAADPELRRRADELRQFGEGIRVIARDDIRRKVEAVRDQIRMEEQAPDKPEAPARPFPWRLITGILVLTGLLWFGYLYFFEQKTTEERTLPPVETPKKPETDTSGPVAGTPGSLDDELGQSAVKPFSTEEISLIDENGQNTGRKIRVDRYWDKEQLYIFREDLLELYLLPGKDLPKPAVLIEQGGAVFLKMPDGSRLHLEVSGKEMPF